MLMRMKCARLLPAAAVLLWTSAALADDASFTALAEAGHWKRVRELVQQRPPGNEAEKIYWQARVKQAFSQFDDAEALARKAISLDSSNARYHALLASICLDELSARPGMFKTMRLAHDVKSELETAHSLDPKNVDIMYSLMQYDWNAPSIGGGDRKAANDLAAQIAQVSPVRGYLAQASLLESETETDTSKAEALLKKAVETAPADYRVRCTLAEFYFNREKNYALAEQEAKTAVPLAPDQSRAYSDLAMVYAHEQQWSKLDALLAEAQKAVPDDLNPQYQAAKTLLTEGHDYERAEQYLRQYISQEPEGHEPTAAAAHWRLGLVFEKEGAKDKAIAELESSLRLQPPYPAARKDLDRLRK